MQARQLAEKLQPTTAAQATVAAQPDPRQPPGPQNAKQSWKEPQNQCHSCRTEELTGFPGSQPGPDRDLPKPHGIPFRRATASRWQISAPALQRRPDSLARTKWQSDTVYRDAPPGRAGRVFSVRVSGRLPAEICGTGRQRGEKRAGEIRWSELGQGLGVGFPPSPLPVGAAASRAKTAKPTAQGPKSALKRSANKANSRTAAVRLLAGGVQYSHGGATDPDRQGCTVPPGQS